MRAFCVLVLPRCFIPRSMGYLLSSSLRPELRDNRDDFDYRIEIFCVPRFDISGNGSSPLQVLPRLEYVQVWAYRYGIRQSNTEKKGSRLVGGAMSATP